MAYRYDTNELADFQYKAPPTPRFDNYEGYYVDPNGGGTFTDLTNYNQDQADIKNNAYQGYSQEQFGTLFDAVNKIGLGLNQYTSGQDQAQRAEQARQSALARQAFQSSLPQAPQMNFQQAAQPAYTGGGWGQQSPTSPMAQSQTPAMQPSPMATYRGGGGWGQQAPAMQQSPLGTLGTTNRGSHGGILGGTE